MILTGEQEARVSLGGVGRKSVTGAEGPPSGPSTEDICQLLGDLSIEEKVLDIMYKYNLTIMYMYKYNLTICNIDFYISQNRIMSVMARDHVLRTSNSSSGFSHGESDAASAFQRSPEESSAASSFSGFSSMSHKAGPASSSSPLLRRSLIANARGCPAIKVKFFERRIRLFIEVPEFWFQKLL